MYKTDIAEIDLNQANVCRSFINKQIGEGDVNADRIGVRIMRNGVPEDMTGAACIGFFIRPDGVTLVINGTVSGNVAYIELPSAAYCKEGNFTLAIKISGTGYNGTVRIVDGTVVNVTTGTLADPSSQIPSVSAFEDMLDDAESAAATVSGLTVSASQISGTRYKISVVKE